MQKNINSNREVRTPNQTRAALFHRRFGAIHMIGPTGRADHRVDASRREPLDIRQHSRGKKEIDGHIDAAKGFASYTFSIFIFGYIEAQRNRKPVLRGKL